MAADIIFGAEIQSNAEFCHSYMETPRLGVSGRGSHASDEDFQGHFKDEPETCDPEPAESHPSHQFDNLLRPHGVGGRAPRS